MGRTGRELITEEMCTELGRLLIAANGFDHSIFELYLGLTNRPRAEVLNDKIASTTLGPLVEAFITEFPNKVHDGRLVARFVSLVPQLREAVARRNAFIHASWWLDEVEAGFTRHRRPRGGGEEMVNFSPSEVFAVTDMLWRITNEIIVLREDVAAAGVPGVSGYSLE